MSSVLEVSLAVDLDVVPGEELADQGEARPAIISRIARAGWLDLLLKFGVHAEGHQVDVGNGGVGRCIGKRA